VSRKIIVLGAIGNCLDIVDTINAINSVSAKPQYKCIGFLDDDPEKWGKKIFEVPVLGGIDKITEYEDAYSVNGIGSPSTFLIKKEIILRTGLTTDRFETIIHPTATVSFSANIGCGVVVFQNVTITTNVTIKNHVIVLPNSVISHNSVIGDYTCIAGGVVVSGDVQVGESCYVGANSSIQQGVTIGDECLVGMGTVVLKDVVDNSVMVGNPARFLRSTR
jgi:sugar O-acyltransferase (sialic acid O-acetyltransferase NeuD family)